MNILDTLQGLSAMAGLGMLLAGLFHLKRALKNKTKPIGRTDRPR